MPLVPASFLSSLFLVPICGRVGTPDAIAQNNTGCSTIVNPNTRLRVVKERPADEGADPRGGAPNFPLIFARLLAPRAEALRHFSNPLQEEIHLPFLVYQ